MFDLSTRDIKYLQGVGPQRAAILNKELNIYSFRDLLYYFPYKYVDRSRLYYIHEIDGNMPYIQLKGKVLSFETIGEGRQRRLVGHFSDGTGIVDLVWFQGLKFVMGKYKANEEYIVFGKPTVFNGRINIAHPDIDPAEELTLSSMGLQPYYNTTEKMKRSNLNSHALEKLMKNLFGALQKDIIEETLSPQLVAQHRLMSLTDALYNIHFPQNPDLLRKAQYRLKFEELFYVQLNILRYTKERRNKFRGLVFGRVGEIFNTFYSQNLPFQLTGAQKRVIKEMRRDMGSGRQMNRLLQGDVGSGKTLVALMTMLIALDNGYQACMMAPTEILATQHYETWQVYEALRERYEEEHAEDFLPKPLLYKVKKQTPATARQMKYLREYAAHYQIKLPDDLAEMTRSEASRLTDQLIARHGKLQRKKSDFNG